MWILAPGRRVATLIVALILLLSGPLMAQDMTPSEQLALDAYRSGELDRAMELYTSALSETDDPNHRARLQVQTAWILFNLGRLDEVSTHLRAAVVEDPTLTLLSRRRYWATATYSPSYRSEKISGSCEMFARLPRNARRPSRRSDAPNVMTSGGAPATGASV